MRVLFLYIIFLMAIEVPLIGQSSYGLSIGISHYNYYLPGQKNDPGQNLSNKPPVGFQLGLHYNWHPNAWFATIFQGQWLYYQSEITAVNSGKLGGGNRTGNFNFNFAELSVVPGVHFGRRAGHFIGAGVFADAALTNPITEVTYRAWSLFDMTMTEVKDLAQQSDFFERSTWGLCGVIGFHLPVKRRIRFMIQASYHYGVAAAGVTALHQYSARQNRIGLHLGVNFLKKKVNTRR